jgi:hypothetical protein
MSDRLVEVGSAIVYHDELGNPRNALCTAVHGPSCINLLVVCSDASMTDQYGRQIARVSSCSHVSSNGTAYGRYWRFADEKPKPYTAPQV